MAKCFYCYNETGDNTNFHPSCSKKIFNTSRPPEIDFSEEDLVKLAKRLIASNSGLTGVQSKLSLDLQKIRGEANKLTIVNFKGGYILKPQTHNYPHLPELEDLCMKMAAASGIDVVPHSLISLTSGQIAYITKRIDRIGNKKVQMEDMCQLSNKLTEQKYLGSHELIYKNILRYSEAPLFDVGRFFEQVLFSYLIGNSDMHLKNFSIYKSVGLGYTLSPAYDMVSTLLITKDKEELALTLNGKKNRIKLVDFETVMINAGLQKSTIEFIFHRYSQMMPKWEELISKSFLPEDYITKFLALLQKKQEIF